MLQNVKSIYFMRIIFSHLLELKKLKLVRYNKSFQKNLNLSIINYRQFSPKIIIHELNGITKIYNSVGGKLEYEGGYLNGKKNGKGKFYLCYGSCYEGEYLNGKKNGYGKEYSEGKIVLEGTYLNGLRHGIFKECWYDVEVIISEYVYGKQSGKTSKYINGKLMFEGEYLNDFLLSGTQYDKYGHAINKLNGIGK